MKCEKCSGPIDARGRYCMQCFEPVAGAGAIQVEKKPIPRRMIFTGAGVLSIIILVSLLLAMRTPSPDNVALDWLEACASASRQRAAQYTTERFERSSSFFQSRSAEMAEKLSEERQEMGLAFLPHEPEYDRSRRPTAAVVSVSFRFDDGMVYHRDVHLRKVGREWKVDDIR